MDPFTESELFDEDPPAASLWTAESSASRDSDVRDSEHRAQAWAVIGAELLGLGTAGCGTLATVGAGSHLWGDDGFLAGFAFACLLMVLGGYALYAELIGALPLPATSREQGERRRCAQCNSPRSEDVSSAATESATRCISAVQATGRHWDESDLEHSCDRVLKNANELLRLILDAELKAKDTLAGVNERLYYNLAARVEAWARSIGCFDDVQKFSGNVAADLPRLKVFVETHLEQWREGKAPRPDGGFGWSLVRGQPLG
jgi:hypothetical protein